MDLLDRARQMSWYHSLELSPGFVTDGIFDLRPFVDRYGLPDRMDGMRVLDVGTWDGFWAFEMERRGATVVSLDLDDERDLDWPANRRPASFPDAPRGQGFAVAKEILGSKVERMNMSVYRATPEEIGQFDLVFCGSVLIHLRDQLLAMERIANLCTGTFISAEEYDRPLGLLPLAAARYAGDRGPAVVFWKPNVRAWRRMLYTAGFATVAERSRFTMRAREGWSVRHVVFHAKTGG